MNTQAESQETAAPPAFSARIALLPPMETDTSARQEAAKESGRFPKAGKPGQRSASAGRSRPANHKKLNPTRGSRRKSTPAVQPTSAKKKSRVGKNNWIEPIAVAIPPATHAPIEEKLPAICEVLPDEALPWTTDEVVDKVRLSGNTIPTESTPPVQDIPSVCDRNEPGRAAAEAITLAPSDTTSLKEPVSPIRRKELLTVTLRLRHSPLAVVLKSLDLLLTQGWSWMQQKLRSPRGKKRLRVCESVSLGEKRFVAVIQVDGQQFLVGGSASSVSTLARLERSQEFSEVFQRHCEQDLSPA